MILSNQTILITGGTSGIGLALGRKLLNLKNEVILMGRNEQKLSQLEMEGFKTITCDLGNQASIETAVMQIQKNYTNLTMLFNNAGVQFNYDFTGNAIPLNKIHQEVTTNFTGQLILTQLLIPFLTTSEKAFIINTTSGLGAFPKADGLIYSATKAAIRNFTVGLHYALKNTSIKVLEFIPPVTDTEMTQGRIDKKMSPDALIEHILPQLKKERRILTVTKMRLFLWIAFLSPNLANKILSK